MRHNVRKRIAVVFLGLVLAVTGCGDGRQDADKGKERLVDAAGDICSANLSAGAVTVDLDMDDVADKRLAERMMSRMEAFPYTEAADTDGRTAPDTGKLVFRFSVDFEDACVVYTVYEHMVSFCQSSGREEKYKSAVLSDAQYCELVAYFLPYIAEKYFYDICETEEMRTPKQQDRLTDFLDVVNGTDYTERYLLACENDALEYNDLERYNDYLYYEKYEFHVNDLDLMDISTYYSVVADGNVGYERYNEYPEWEVLAPEQIPEPAPLLSGIVNPADYQESYLVRAEEEDVVREVYVSESGEICLVYFSGELCNLAYVRDGEAEFVKYYVAFCDEQGAETAEQIFAAVENMEQYGSYSPDEQTAQDDFEYSIAFNENNLFDFEAERIRGEQIENPHIVESYREYFAVSDAFTIRITSKRNDMLMYSYTTKSGDDYYFEDGLQVYGEECLITRNLGVDGKHFYLTCVEGDAVVYNLDPYNESGLYVAPIIWADGEFSDDDTFVEAYRVTIGGEEYICEVWHSGLTDYNIYCKDDKVVAMEAYYQVGTEQSVIEYLSDEAETEYLAAPDAVTDEDRD